MLISDAISPLAIFRVTSTAVANFLSYIHSRDIRLSLSLFWVDSRAAVVAQQHQNRSLDVEIGWINTWNGSVAFSADLRNVLAFT